MVQESLVQYIKNLLQQNYDYEAIRSALLNAGYSSNDIEVAFRLAGYKPKRIIPTKILIVSFLVLLVLAGGMLIVLKTLQAPPAVLSFSLNLFSTEVGVGQDVAVNADIQNPGGRSVSCMIDFSIDGPSGKIASKTESFKMTYRTSVPVSLKLPADVPPGSYVLKAVLSYSGKSASQYVTFDVVEKARLERPVEALVEKPVEKAKEAQLVCPGGCDDLNFCTSDACVNGECVHSPVVPCCGNGACESGESASSCVLDCGERPVNTDEIRENAKSLASSNLPKAIETCDSMAQRVLIDGCLVGVSESAESKEPCARIVTDDVRDSCYIPFSYKNDFSVCAEITNPYMKNSCLSLAQISATKPQA